MQSEKQAYIPSQTFLHYFVHRINNFCLIEQKIFLSTCNQRNLCENGIKGKSTESKWGSKYSSPKITYHSKLCPSLDSTIVNWSKNWQTID